MGSELSITEEIIEVYIRATTPKLSLDQDSGELRRRFLREAEAAARLSHPHIVAIHEAGEDAAICYIASEYCAGPTLAEWLRAQQSPVAPQLAAELARQLASAIEHAHSRGVLHRDIKPSNVLLVVGTDNDGPQTDGTPTSLCAKLTDFGLAKLLEHRGDDTRSGAVLGTPSYMAPEQAGGRTREMDVRTDVYGLGTVLYELLTGRPPAVGESDIDIVKQVVFDEPAAPRKLRGDVPRDLEAICLKCLEKDPARRYQTAAELAADLTRFLAGEPTLARPLARAQRTIKWARRRPAPAIAVMVSAAAMCLLVAGGILYTVRLRAHAEQLRQALTGKRQAEAKVQVRDREVWRSYPADMRLAQQSWQADQLNEAIALLEKHKPRERGADRRSFAWHFLWRLCHPNRIVLEGHQATVYTTEFSPDGLLLATGAAGGEVCLWDVRTGARSRTWCAHQGDVSELEFSPDGARLATAGTDASAAMWNVATGELLRRFDLPGGDVWAVTFSPDGHTLLAAGAAGVIKQWNAGDGSPLGELVGHTKLIQSLDVSPDGTLLASASDDTTVRLWDLKTLQPLTTLSGHKKAVITVSFSHNGIWLASGGEDENVWLWDLAKRQPLSKIDSRSGHIQQVAFTPNDRSLLVASHSGSLQSWNLDARTRSRRWLESGSNPVFALAISVDGRQVAAGGAERSVYLWSDLTRHGETRFAEIQAGESTQLSPDGRLVAIGDQAGLVRVVDRATAAEQYLFQAHSDRILGIRFSPDCRLLATACHDRSARLWRLSDRKLLAEYSGHTGRINSIAFAPDGSRLATCAHDGKVKLWDASSGALLREVLSTPAYANEVAFSPDGKSLAAVAGKKLWIWDTAEFQTLAVLSGHTSEVNSLAWSPDGRLIATVGKDDSIRLWNTQQFRSAGVMYGNQHWTTAAAFSPDGQTLAIGGYDQSVTVWDVPAQALLLRFDAHRRFVTQVGFADDGRTLWSFSAGKPCELLFWCTAGEQTLPRSRQQRR